MSNENVAQPQREPTFMERKTAELQAERAKRVDTDHEPEEKENRPERTPERAPRDELESAPVEPMEGLVDEQAEDEYEDDDQEAAEATPDDDPDESDEPQVDWQSRYKEAERKISEVTANRQAMESEHAETMATTLQLRHSLEDTFTEAKQYAGQYKVAFDNQISQLEQAFTTGQIPPDQLPAARQQYQALVNQRNGLVQQVQQLTQKEQEAKQVDRERKAEIARVRLARTIPNWGRQKHQELGEYAQSLGYSADEFNENLDYRFLEVLNDSMQLRRAGETVKNVKRRKKAGGPARNAQTPVRGPDGKYRKAQQDFAANPGQKGRFAEMKMRELERERRR